MGLSQPQILPCCRSPLELSPLCASPVSITTRQERIGYVYMYTSVYGVLEDGE